MGRCGGHSRCLAYHCAHRVIEDRVDCAILAAALILYIANRWTLFSAWVLPWEVAKYHFGDFCGGVFFPAYVNLVLAFFGRDARVSNIASMLLVITLCSFVWEVVGPLLVESSVGDLWDVAAYYLGGGVFLVLRGLLNNIETNREH